MAKLLDNNLVLENIVTSINNLSSVSELPSFCDELFKNLISFKNVFLLFKKFENYILLDKEQNRLNLSKNNEFINLLKKNDNNIDIFESINLKDVDQTIFKDELNDILVLKLISGKKEIGYIIFLIDKSLSYDSQEINKLISLISMKADNLILSEANENLSDSKNLKIINQVIKKAISTIHISQLIDFLTEYLSRQLDFDNVFIVINKDKSEDFSGVSYNNNKIEKINIENFQNISQINNYRELTDKIKFDEKLKGLIDTDTFIALGLIIRGKTVGFIGVDNYKSKRVIQDDEIHLLQSIATQVSISVDNSILYEDMQLNALGFKNLFEVASSFNLIIDYEQAAKVVVEKICSTISVSQGYLVSFEIDSYCRVIAARNEKSTYLNSEIQMSDKMKYAIASKNIVFYNQDDSSKEKCFDLKSALIIPLFIKNRLTGLLCIGETNEVRDFTDHDLKLIETISNQAVVTLENAQLYNKLEDMVVERTVELIDSNKALQSQKEKLEILSQRLQSIISSIPDGILVINKEDQILSVNPAFMDIVKFVNRDIQIEALTGLSINKLINLVSTKDDKNKKNLSELLDAIINPKVEENTESEVENEDSKSYDLVLENGISHYYKVLSAPVKTDNNHKIKNNMDKKNQVIVFHDVTKEKEIDKLKSDFIAVVSHELKTPVSAMMGFATLIEDGIAGEITPQQQEYLYKIQMQGERLIRLINDLLDFSKLEAGQMPLYLQLLDSDEVVNEIVETLRPLADEKSMTLRANVAEDLPAIYVDPDKLKQILINLISNAIKFTPETTGLIEVKVIFIEENKELLFSVSDNGIGIPEKDKPRLFDRFYQVDNTSTRKYGGTGLGLAIVKKLVELNHGQLWVESKMGSGSTFYFTVPLPEENQEN